MILAVTVIAAFLAPQEGAREALQETAKHYASLKSYSVKIESHNSSGLFPGNYEQTLAWKKGNRFEIITTKPSHFIPKEGQPGAPAATYYCNGTEVLTIRADKARSVRLLNTDPNIQPGYEVTGGLVLSWLLGSPTSQFIFSPPESFSVAYSWGDRKTWEGFSVREAVLTMGSGDRTQVISLFLDAKRPTMAGQEYMENGERHYRVYREAKENPELPDKLGDHPPQG
jgi:hypothetical protein